MKIFSFIGSPRGVKSDTYKLVKKIINKAKQKTKVDIEYDIFTSSKFTIKNCRGCTECFFRGNCKLDKVDNFDLIKKKMLEADMIILGSPVYAATVSAQMKTFIDRLAYWAHLFILAGKPVVTVVTASSNSLSPTNEYLKKIVGHMGAEVITSIMCTVDMPPMLELSEFNEEELPKHIELIVEYINGEKKVKSTEFHENVFQYYKKLYSVSMDIETSETKFWKESGYLVCNTFQDVLNKVHKSS